MLNVLAGNKSRGFFFFSYYFSPSSSSSFYFGYALGFSSFGFYSALGFGSAFGFYSYFGFSSLGFSCFSCFSYFYAFGKGNATLHNLGLPNYFAYKYLNTYLQAGKSEMLVNHLIAAGNYFLYFSSTVRINAN